MAMSPSEDAMVRRIFGDRTPAPTSERPQSNHVAKEGTVVGRASSPDVELRQFTRDLFRSGD